MAGARDNRSGVRPVLTALVRRQAGDQAGDQNDAQGNARANAQNDDALHLCAPAVGLWRDMPAPGTLITPDARLGHLEILGVVHELRAPKDAYGIAEWPDDQAHAAAAAPMDRDLARQPVQYGQALVRLRSAETLAGAGFASAERARPDAAVDGQPVFRAPMSGRYYNRPAPDRAPFLAPGDELAAGTTICLLEVMKTFNRVTYGGADVPERARVVRVVPDNESDLAAGDVILYIEALD